MAARAPKATTAKVDESIEVSKSVAPASLFDSVGRTGLNRDTWYVNEEFLNDLRGQRGVRTYKEMRENDPIVGSIFFAIEMFLRKVAWYVEPENDPRADEKNTQAAIDNAEYMEQCRLDMSITWPDFISEIMSMMQYGWSYFEILYKYRNGDDDSGKDKTFHKSKYADGKIGWRKFEIRSQDSFERWQWDDEGGLAGMWQRPAPTYQMLFNPIEKSLLFRTESRKNNPEGRSALRNAYRPYYFKKRIEEIEGIGVERDLAGLPFAEIPAEMLHPDASDDDKATVNSIIDLVKNIRRDQQEGVVWPQAWNEAGQPMYTFRLMNSGGSRQFNTSEIIQRYESRMAMVVLADFILLGNDSAGSFAMSTTKSGLFQAALGAWLDMIQDVLNNYAVPRLFALNGIKDNLPKFRHDNVVKPSLTDLSVYIAAIAGAGGQLFPDTELENYLREQAQLPARETQPEQATKEGNLRDQTLLTQIEQQKAAADQAANPEKYAKMGQQPSGSQVIPPGGKQPGSTPGAPTATTGPVKSKLPPSNRRNTKKDVAANNTGG